MTRIPRARILVTGGGGQLGRWLAVRGARLGVLAAVHAAPRAELDLADAASIAAALDVHRPDVVINAAAYTNVDGAEVDGEAARAINADGAGALAAACAVRGIGLVHVSTDYVLGLGPGEAPADPADPAAAPALPALDPADPQVAGRAVAGVYAETKWRGELAVRAACPDAVIVRTAWVYTGPGRAALGLGGDDFVTTMLRLATERDTLTVVDDQWGSPTYAADLAGALLAVALRLAGGAGARGGSGAAAAVAGTVLHAAGSGRATWCELARATFGHAGLDPGRVQAIPTSEFPRPAARPAFSVLGDTEWRAAGLPPMPHWRDALRRGIAGKS